MNLVLTVTALAILAIGIYYNKTKPPEQIISRQTEVLSEEKEETPTPTFVIDNVKEEPTIYIYNSTPTDTPAPKQNSNPTLSNFIYPNSEVIINSNDLLKLENGDNPDSITNWYKDKIKSLGMNVTSFVTTKTNGNVLNKLAGANSQEKIQIIIDKRFDNNKVSIEISKESD